MSTRGRKPKPTALKELAGNPGKRRLPQNEPKPKGILDAPPAWMSDGQKAGWAYALMHAPRNVLKRIDSGALVIWVIAEDLHRQASQEQNSLGRLLVKTEKAGATQQSPYLPIINKQAVIMLKAAQELGFSPAARPRLATGRPVTNDSDDATVETDIAAVEDLDEYLARKPTRLN